MPNIERRPQTKDKVTDKRHEVENRAGKAEACGTCKSNAGLEGLEGGGQGKGGPPDWGDAAKLASPLHHFAPADTEVESEDKF